MINDYRAYELFFGFFFYFSFFVRLWFTCFRCCLRICIVIKDRISHKTHVAILYIIYTQSMNVDKSLLD